MPSALLPFEGANLKLDRAKFHVAEYCRCEAEFLKKKRFSVGVEHPDELGDVP